MDSFSIDLLHTPFPLSRGEQDTFCNILFFIFLREGPMQDALLSKLKIGKAPYFPYSSYSSSRCAELQLK